MPSVAVLDGAIWAGALGRSVKVGAPQSYLALARSRAFGVTTKLISVMGVFALLLAAVGLFGVVAFLAACRTREFAVRSSLGAQRSEIGWLVAGETARTVGWGMAAGMGAAWFVPRLLGAVFYRFLPASPVPVLAGVGIVVMVVAAAASLAPALRATRADPLEALRYQ
jgi:putative ABC transport system permease protein